jgi:glycine oxidase
MPVQRSANQVPQTDPEATRRTLRAQERLPERPSPKLPAAASVVVVGAGIIGLSLAFELARRKVDVLALERFRVGGGAAGVAAGMLAPASEAEDENPELVRLALESQRLYPAFVEAVQRVSGLDCGYRREGTLLIALGRDDEEELARLRRLQEQLGVSAKWLAPAQARGLEPALSPRITGALLASDDHQVDPRTLLAALERAVEALGGRVVADAQVTGFETHGGRLSRVIGRITPPAREPDARSGVGLASAHAEGDRPFSVRCEAAVLAAGAWSSRDLIWPASPLGVRPVKGQLVRLRGPELLQHVVRGPHAYLVPRHGGELVVGATMEEQGLDPLPTAGAVMDLLWNARLVVPAVYDLEFAEVNVGFRPAARDHLPLIGATEVRGLYAGTGHFRHGVLLAPATAALLADLMIDGRLDPMLIPFGPDRLSGAAAAGRNRERQPRSAIAGATDTGSGLAGAAEEPAGGPT